MMMDQHSSNEPPPAWIHGNTPGVEDENLEALAALKKDAELYPKLTEANKAIDADTTSSSYITSPDAGSHCSHARGNDGCASCAALEREVDSLRSENEALKMMLARANELLGASKTSALSAKAIEERGRQFDEKLARTVKTSLANSESLLFGNPEEDERAAASRALKLKVSSDGNIGSAPASNDSGGGGGVVRPERDDVASEKWYPGKRLGLDLRKPFDKMSLEGFGLSNKKETEGTENGSSGNVDGEDEKRTSMNGSTGVASYEAAGAGASRPDADGKPQQGVVEGSMPRKGTERTV
jgi:hypothetical protein